MDIWARGGERALAPSWARDSERALVPSCRAPHGLDQAPEEFQFLILFFDLRRPQVGIFATEGCNGRHVGILPTCGSRISKRRKKNSKKPKNTSQHTIVTTQQAKGTSACGGRKPNFQEKICGKNVPPSWLAKRAHGGAQRTEVSHVLPNIWRIQGSVNILTDPFLRSKDSPRS